MDRTASLTELIRDIPFIYHQEIESYLKFIQFRHKEYLEKDELSQDELDELKSRHKAYLNNPKAALSLEVVKQQMMAKYGL